MPKRPIKIDDLFRLILVGDPQISPDGSRILFTKKVIQKDENKYLSHLAWVDQHGNVSQLTQGSVSCSGGRWSPSGSRIAFVSAREEKLAQLYILPATGGEAVKLTSLPEGGIGGIAWSPDEKHIAFSFRPTDENWTQAAAKQRDSKNLSTPPREIDDIWYRLDGDGYFLGARYALYVVHVESGEAKVVFKPNSRQDGMSFAWNPNGQELVVTNSGASNPLFDHEDDRIYRVNLEGQVWEIPTGAKGPKYSICWSPDAKTLAFAGRTGDSYGWDARNTQIFVVPSEGGTATCLTDGLDYCFAASTLSDTKEFAGEAPLEWLPNSSELLVQIVSQGKVNVGKLNVKSKELTSLTEEKGMFSYGKPSSNGSSVAVCFGTPLKPQEVGILDIGGGYTILTKFNETLTRELDLVEPEEFWVESTDGHQVHAWVLKPVGYLAPKRYSAVLQVHGGPHAQYGWAFFHEFQVLAAEGYVVVYSNPRGSKGYGEDHCKVITGDWGNKDWDDIQAVTRWMQHQSYIHPGEIGIMGGSYGGYMTNWAVGHSKDYRAAITDRCVSNMVSMGGSSDFPFNNDGYFPGCFFGGLDRIKKLWEMSPIAYFEGVSTPMLIIHSEGDLRCNVEQGEQVFAALQAQGVESRFVRYPQSTFHGLSRSGPPDLRVHRLREITDWWHRWFREP